MDSITLTPWSTLCWVIIDFAVRSEPNSSSSSIAANNSAIEGNAWIWVVIKINNTVELIGTITVDIEGATAAGKENSNALEGISASSEQQTASMEEVTITANRLGSLAEDLKVNLGEFGGDGRSKKKSKKRISKLKTTIKKRKLQQE